MQLDEQHEVEGGDLLDDGPGGHRAVEVEPGVVGANLGAGGLELTAEVAGLVRLEEIDEDRQRRGGADAGGRAFRASHGSELEALLEVRRAHADPLHLGHGGDRRQRGDGQAGLVGVVVTAEQLGAEPGERVLRRLVQPVAQQDEAVHVLVAARAEGGGVGLQRGIEALRGRQDPGREAERAPGVLALAPGIRLVPHGRLLGALRRPQRTGLDGNARGLLGGRHVSEGRIRIHLAALGVDGARAAASGDTGAGMARSGLVPARRSTSSAMSASTPASMRGPARPAARASGARPEDIRIVIVKATVRAMRVRMGCFIVVSFSGVSPVKWSMRTGSSAGVSRSCRAT